MPRAIYTESYRLDDREAIAGLLPIVAVSPYHLTLTKFHQTITLGLLLDGHRGDSKHGSLEKTSNSLNEAEGKDFAGGRSEDDKTLR